MAQTAKKRRLPNIYSLSKPGEQLHHKFKTDLVGLFFPFFPFFPFLPFVLQNAVSISYSIYRIQATTTGMYLLFVGITPPPPPHPCRALFPNPRASERDTVSKIHNTGSRASSITELDKFRDLTLHQPIQLTLTQSFTVYD